MRIAALPLFLLALAGCSEGLNPMKQETPEAVVSEPSPTPPPEPAPVQIPTDLPALTSTLETAAPAGGTPSGGSIDGILVDEAAGTLTIAGWVLLKSAEAAPELKVFAPGAASIVSIGRVVRDDVVRVVGDTDLRFSGFSLVLQTQPGTPVTEVCISTTDATYGETALPVQAGVVPGCTSYVPPAPQ